METIFSHKVISPVLNNYPREKWTRAVIALIVYGIRALGLKHNLSILSLERLESLSGTQSSNSFENTQISNFIQEINTIKDELFRLNQKVDKTMQRGYKMSGSWSDRKGYDTYAQVETLARPYIYRKPSSAWRKKKKIRSQSPKRHTTQRDTKSTARDNKATIKRNIPLYLKNVQSRILPAIEKDKLEYNMRQHFGNRREEEVNVQEDDNRVMGIADKYLHNSIINYFSKAYPNIPNSPSDQLFSSQEDIKSSNGSPIKEVNGSPSIREEYEVHQYDDALPYSYDISANNWRTISHGKQTNLK